MTNAHDFTLAIRAVAPGTDVEIIAECAGLNHQAVVPRGLDRTIQACEQSLAVMKNLVGLAMHEPFSPDDFGPKGMADRLMTQADAQNRQLLVKPRNDAARD